ncbi:hypothetical protein [Polynucleobacter sp. AP-Sving-400A-A2]|uniref:hypothetical protein n=1 Tax=Polynucleobacter sp. AP-Sving-400A-A2 TaxID=2081049 RepID=UPI001BFD624A|nr:hypothetical protein [Polynucleobacter sp. AP-Sving-400A-A2]QWE13759.1 hypothetical protein C2758_06070 [Polynucleobacter sp. AP-Sving-400A-A2]
MAAIAEFEIGKGQALNMVDELMADLHRDEIEDQEDLKLADRAMREMRRGGVKAIPIDQVIENIDLRVKNSDNHSL